MKNSQLKNYALVVAISLCCGSASYADNSQLTDTQAYDALTQAQADAVAANEEADKENKSEDFSKRVAKNTYAFLKAFNAYALNWLQIYNSPTSNELGTMFGDYVLNSQNNIKTQLTLLNSLYKFNDPNRAIYELQPFTPDVNYATLIKQNEKDSKTGKPIAVPNNTKLYGMEFVKNASGLSIQHLPPSSIPGGSNIDLNALTRYKNFYNIVNSVASYNAYVLSEHLADLQNNFSLTQTQMDLKNYASSNDWLKHINEEQSIGVLLRQLLLFTSQMYIISLQSLETQKELLAATSMTNTMVILGSGFYEKTLLDKVKSGGG